MLMVNNDYQYEQSNKSSDNVCSLYFSFLLLGNFTLGDIGLIIRNISVLTRILKLYNS